MSVTPHQLDIPALALALVLVISGWALNGLLAALGVLTGLGYLLLRPVLLRHSAVAADGRQHRLQQETDPLWADTEVALRVLDQGSEGDDLEAVLERLARAGRRAVERGRRAPAEPSSQQARHLLCLAGDTLQTYLQAGEPATEQAALYDLFEELADTLEHQSVSSAAEEQLPIRLRVLQRELGSTVNKDQS